jgi:hypothetical protein
MAKQTFTTGQVLTAAQMTSLQQTAMGGGAAVTKTASYVLVAADAGTTIQMNSASPTTITVNTALFAAGDVVFIQNIGAGTCTVTAGTATVTTAGSLALTQWEGGQLYFTSTSASIFFDYIQAGTSIPLTTKGDLFGFDTANARIPIGTNNQVLTADSAQALGLKWATPSSSPTSANSTVNTGESTTSFTYNNLTTTQSVTLTTGTKALVIIGASVYASSGTNSAACMTYAVSGATTIAASDTPACKIMTIAGETVAASKASVVTLTAGSNTFTMKFANGNNTNTTVFNYRSMTVIDLGS